MIGGIATGISNIFGSIMGYKANENTNEANMRLAEYQADRNEQFWNMQNEYNSPEQQMNRLQSAGLNPN